MAAARSYMELTVGDVMAPVPVTARPGNTLVDVTSMMDLSAIRHLPVIDSEGRVMGILSNRDLLRATGRDPRSAVVADMMTEDVLSVRAETRLCEASALLLDRKIGALPVVDRDEVLVGIVTETDFVRIAHEVCGGAVLADD